MALTKKGEFWYGTTSGDTQAELRSYSVANRHEAVRFAASKCDCGCRTFALQTDEEAGVAIRTCTDCGQEHLMGDSAEYVEEAVPEVHECVCENEVFELVSGVSVYEGTHDVRWYYIACRCVECNLLIRPSEVLSRISDVAILEVAHHALGVLLQHRHVIVGRFA